MTIPSLALTGNYKIFYIYVYTYVVPYYTIRYSPIAQKIGPFRINQLYNSI